MKLPRDVSGSQLAKALSALGYVVTRQKGSHMRVTTQHGGEHHEVIPAHNPIKTGTPLTHPQKRRRAPRFERRGVAR